MIQVYSPGNTDYEVNGDMTLFPDEAAVHPVLNQEWTAELHHIIDDEGRWKYIVEDAVIKMPSFNKSQLFRIKKKEKTDSGVTAEMQPIFMDAKDDCFLVDVRPTDKTGQEALDLMTSPNKKYKASSNINKTSTAYYQTKNLIEALNGEDENSFVSRWGGEIVFDNFTAIINDRAGGDYGVEILYGKNIQQDGFSEEVDTKDVVTRIVPKAFNGRMIEGKEPWIDSPLIDKYPTIRHRVMEFEDIKMREDAQEGDEDDGIIICDTQAELKKALTEKCNEQFDSGIDKPKVSISADLILLEGTDLYEDIKDLVKVSMGDTVHCRHSRLGIVTDARVIELEWDSVKDEIKSVVLGDYQESYIDNAASMMNRIESAIRSDGTVIGAQVQGIINGVKAQLKAQSSVAQKQKVRAMLFEDLDPESPTFGAMCLGTMGFEIAAKRTADGRDWDWKTFGTGAGFFADFIVAGTMLADRIKGGTLTLGGKNNGDGVAKILDESGKTVVTIDLNGIKTENLGAGGVQVKDGMISIKNQAGKTTAIIHYQDNGVSIQSYGGTLSYIRVGNNGTAAISGKSGNISIPASGPMQINVNDGLQASGRTTKSGKAEFSDGTYLEFKDGFLVGGNTSEGSF